MAIYEYSAYNAKGRQQKGLIEADSSRGARAKLKQKGIFATEIHESTADSVDQGWNVNISFNAKKISTANLAIMTRQLATLIVAGMPLVEALRALQDQTEHSYLKKVLAEVTDDVNEGSTLAKSMEKYPKVFPKLYSNMIASGEASGTLDLILTRLADLLEAQAALQRKVVSALTYPTLMVVLCVLVLALLLGYVVPQITAIFADKEELLPLPTVIVIGLSDIVQGYWWLFLLVGVSIIVGIRQYYRTPGGRYKLDGLKLRLPLFGSLFLRVATSRVARNLGAMLASGVELLTALGIARNIVDNAVLEEVIEDSIVGVREGGSLAAELNKGKHFPKLLIHMVAVGERSGQLEPMLMRAAENYENEVDAYVSGLTSILEPLLIIFLAVIVGVILAAIMLPMLEMTSLAG